MVLEKFERKCEGKKIERSEGKKCYKNYFKINILNLINYFYMFFKLILLIIFPYYIEIK